MTAQLDSFQRMVAVLGSLMFTALVVVASVPHVPVAWPARRPRGDTSWSVRFPSVSRRSPSPPSSSSSAARRAWASSP